MSTGPILAQLVTDALAERDALNDEHEMFRPHGECATGCGHPATEIWEKYRGESRWEYRCKCCVAQGKLDRALWYREQVPALKAAVATAKENC